VELRAYDRIRRMDAEEARRATDAAARRKLARMMDEGADNGG